MGHSDFGMMITQICHQINFKFLVLINLILHYQLDPHSLSLFLQHDKRIHEVTSKTHIK